MVRILILIVAVLCGGVAAWLALSDPAPPKVEVVEAPAPATVEVLVSSAQVKAGTILKPEMMRWQAWPAETSSADLINRAGQPDAIATLSGSVVRSQFGAGEPIREDKLAPAGSGFMSAMLPPGKRAAAVRISAETTAGGFVLPNDRVDVIETLTPADTDSGRSSPISRTILRDIRVLAVDQTQDIDPADPQRVVVGRRATLELSSVQAETVMTAQAEGTLSLALRSVSDQVDEAMPIARRTTSTIRVHRDGKIQEFEVSRHSAENAQ
ncbi:Flp pilus assembly protein CpaB [Consotaella salsifontis]|uniref:Pilus assembly protein CpaB n=1 Tax=Consotaella salsifontis TaxID=1365950 RepID=A0A1T4PVC1_9HYPH|nr:Flp pilus assembly protein CpaB [Consotaella salsifontis]SJZ95399.1 pilus assembly protein CpaB [Consotaella salsifontis]